MKIFKLEDNNWIQIDQDIYIEGVYNKISLSKDDAVILEKNKDEYISYFLFEDHWEKIEKIDGIPISLEDNVNELIKENTCNTHN